MKITEVKTFVMRGVERNWLFIKIETDEGVHGWGEATLEFHALIVEQAVQELSRHLVGQDPSRIEYLWQTMFRHRFWRGGVVMNSAISGVDHALWDIAGKVRDAPVYKLLGGECRDRLRLYGHGGPDNVQELLDLGFTGIKTGGADIESLTDNVRRVREIAGKDFAIMVDNHGVSTPQDAHQKILAIEPYDLLFFEEPCPPDNPDVLARIAAAHYRTPIATGERLFSRWDFWRVVENQWVAVLQPDLCHAGGISECRRIAAMAETYYIQMAPHNPNGPVSTAACLHLAAAIPNFLTLEYVYTNEPWRSQVQKQAKKMVAVDGHLELPTAPGLGIDLDEEVLRSRPYEPMPLWGNFADDGSLLDV